MNRLITLAVLCFSASHSMACPNLSGLYAKQYEDGLVYLKVHQVGCERVQIMDKSHYLGHQNSDVTKTFFPDGKHHSKDIPVSHWHGDKLIIDGKHANVYYSLDSAGNLDFSDGMRYPQCHGICEEIAARVIGQESILNEFKTRLKSNKPIKSSPIN